MIGGFGSHYATPLPSQPHEPSIPAPRDVISLSTPSFYVPLQAVPTFPPTLEPDSKIRAISIMDSVVYGGQAEGIVVA